MEMMVGIDVIVLNKSLTRGELGLSSNGQSSIAEANRHSMVLNR